MSKNISYNAAIYLRLSKEDGDVTDGGKAVSNSIANQEELVRDYLKSQADIQVHSVYKDDGYSGVNFNRPMFQKMLEDIKSGAVNCVIVKDLSRFGRNYIESGRYIEKIFPMLGVRFIAVNDHYDSLSEDTGTDMIIPFKNLINDAYCRDISIKVRSHLDTKRKNGEYIGAFVVYGYRKDPEDKNRLIVDDYAAGVVRDIFDMKKKGMSHCSIARKLNDDGILSPLEYMKSRGINLNTSFQRRIKSRWSHSSVLRILQNEMYTGTMIQGKTGTPNYKIKVRSEKAEDAWIKVSDAHEAIIPKQEFMLVQDLLLRDTKIAPDADTLYPFSGMIFCADCGAPMVRKPVSSGGRKYIYYICSENKRDKNSCKPHRISESALEKAALQAVTDHIDNVLMLEKVLQVLEEAPMTAANVRKYDERIRKKSEEVEKVKRRKLRLYEDLTDGILSNEEYELLREQYSGQIAKGVDAIKAFQEERQLILDNQTERHQWIEEFISHKGLTELSRNDVVHLIDRIEVVDAHHINVRLRFADEYERIMEQLFMIKPDVAGKEAI